MTKHVLKKLSIISISKKTTGSFYIDGKAHYSTLIDICCSIIIFIGLSIAFLNMYNSLGTIDYVKISMISNWKSFFDQNSTYPMKFFSSENKTRIYETPLFSGEYFSPNDSWPIGVFPMNLRTSHSGCSNGTLDLKFKNEDELIFEKQIEMLYRNDYVLKESVDYHLNEVE